MSNDADYAIPFKPGRYVVMQAPWQGVTAIPPAPEVRTQWISIPVPVGTVVLSVPRARVVLRSGGREDLQSRRRC